MASESNETVARWMESIEVVQRPVPPVDALRTGLLVVDVQQYFAGIAAPILDRIREAVEVCRAHSMPVVFTQHGHANLRVDGGMLGQWWADAIIEGGVEHGLLETLDVREDDLIVHKKRYDAFHGTHLESILRSQGVDDLVIVGVMTNLCVESTARSAFVRDFRVRVLADATATATEQMHVASLLNLAYGFAHVQTTSEWVRAVREAQAPLCVEQRAG